MLSNSRNVALVIASFVSIITTSFLTLVPNVPWAALLVCLILSFSSGYILTYFTVEYFIFGQVKEINDRLSRLMEDDFSFVEHQDENNVISPLLRINENLYTYAEKKQKEIEDLKKSEAFRREFIADISHELKTPIFAAQGFVHTLLDGALKDKNVRNKFLKKAAKSLDGLDRLVQDLLTISNMEKGEIRMEFEYFNLYQLTLEVFDQFEGKAEKRDMIMKINDEAGKETTVYADRQKIYQAMLNLVSNALKYKKDGTGLLEVDFIPTENQIEVTVRDHGLGIPEEHMSRIFERFYRVDKSRSKEKGGTGLGLSIVKHILEAHQTTILAESKPGEGSIFKFKLNKFESYEQTSPVQEE